MNIQINERINMKGMSYFHIIIANRQWFAWTMRDATNILVNKLRGII